MRVKIDSALHIRKSKYMKILILKCKTKSQVFIKEVHLITNIIFNLRLGIYS